MNLSDKYRTILIILMVAVSPIVLLLAVFVKYGNPVGAIRECQAGELRTLEQYAGGVENFATLPECAQSVRWQLKQYREIVNGYLGIGSDGAN